MFDFRTRLTNIIQQKNHTHTAFAHPGQGALLTSDPHRSAEITVDKRGAMDGTSLLHYRILRKIGQGGMGEVYLAEDTRLGKLVAIKTLPDSIRGDKHRLKRFRNEAKAAARLDHPNIVQIYGIEEADDLIFFVMEYVEGKPLAECIGKKGITVDQFYDWFIPITGALAHAHDMGVIHRDLKPANIMISDEGIPKILDFGLARIERRDVENYAPQELPTLSSEATTIEKDILASFTSSMTSPNAVVGTPAYMAPEQAQGQSVDFRSDLFSLGIVMYESLTGIQPFRGDNTLSTFSNLLQRDPSPTTHIKPASPGGLWRLIRRCLQKVPNQRYQATLDVLIDLEELQANKDSNTVELETGVYPSMPDSPFGQWCMSTVLSTGVMIFLAGVLAFYAIDKWWSPVPTEKLVRKFKMPIEGTLSRQDNPVISPDGKKIAYTHKGRLWVRELEKTEAREIPDTQGADSPFWAPESDWIGYVQDYGVEDKPKILVKSALDGGKKTILCDLPGYAVWGATWGPEGYIIVSIMTDYTRAELYQVSDQSGPLEPLLQPDSLDQELMLGYPHYLSGDLGILYSVLKSDTTSHIYVYSAGQKNHILSDPRQLGVIAPVYDPAGFLVYRYGAVTRGEIWAVQFDINNMKAGAPFLITQNGSDPSVSREGTMVYRTTTPRDQQLVWVNRNGTLENRVGDTQRVINYISLSPDNQRIAVSGLEDANWDVWVHNNNGTKKRISFHDFFDGDPTWSPDGSEIVFAGKTSEDVPASLYITQSDGRGEVRSLEQQATTLGMPSWSSDGRYILFQAEDEDGQWGLWYLDLNNNTGATLFLNSVSNEITPVFSPGGTYVAYASDITGSFEVYVRPFPPSTGIWQVSHNGGLCPRWNDQGNELFFLEENSLMVTAVNTENGFQNDMPRKLFSGDQLGTKLYDTSDPNHRVYDVSSDANLIIVAKSVGEMTMDLMMVQNWREEFNR